MIVLISKKDFIDNIEDLSYDREFRIIDGVGSSDISRYGDRDRHGDNAYYKNLIAPSALTDPNKMDRDRIEAKLDGYLKCPKITEVAAVACAAQLKNIDSNVFIIVKNSTYKAVAKKLIKRFKKIICLDEKSNAFLLYKGKDELFLNDKNGVMEANKSDIRKLDKQIDELTSDVESGAFDYFDDTDMKKAEKKLKKLRKKREELAKDLDSGKAKKVSKSIKRKYLKKAYPNKDDQKIMDKFVRKYHDKIVK